MTPLILGIIGHCDLRPADRAKIEEALRDWIKEHPDKFGNRPLALLTSLAPGADQLATGVLRSDLTARPNNYRVDLRIRPVLPFDEDVYLDSVASNSNWSRDDLAKAFKSKAKVLNPRWASASKAKTEEDCYRDAGHYIAENAHILIALWDGIHREKIGGTSDTLRHALCPECQEARRKSGRAPLEIHWLAIPRESNPYPASEAFTWQKLPIPNPVVKCEFARASAKKKAELLLPVTLGIASVLCSWLGYLLSYGFAFTTIVDKFLVAASHLLLAGLDPVPEGPGSLLIRIGRVLAVIFVVATIEKLVNRLFRWRGEFALWRTGRRVHHLVCGLGWRGRQLLADAAEEKCKTKLKNSRHTIVIERTSDEAASDLCSLAGARLIEGDATNPETLSKAGLAKVDNAFIVCDRDETNMRVVHELAEIAQTQRSSLSQKQSGPFAKARERQMVCCVALRSQHHFEVLQKSLPGSHGIDLRIFNAESVTARMFLERHPIDRFAASPNATAAEVILLGNSRMAWAILREVLQQGIFEEDKDLQLTWLTRDASAACHRFISQFPVFKKASEPTGSWKAEPEHPWETEKILPPIHFFDLPPSDRGLLDLFEREDLAADSTRVTSVIVALDDPAESAATAHVLAAHLERVRREKKKDVTLSCYYNTPEDIYRYDIDRALNRDFESLPVSAFSDFMGDCSMEVVRGDNIDTMARRFHGIYSLDNDINHGKAKPDDCFAAYCDGIWSKVPENDKDSNRQKAAHEFVKRRVRTRLKQKGLNLDAREGDEALGRIEHRRWCAEYLLKGFRPLTRILSLESAPFTLNEKEKKELEEWFADQKQAFKRAKLHADLIPFDHFDQVLGKHAAKERAKDFRQTGVLDELLRHDTDATNSRAIDLIQRAYNRESSVGESRSVS